MTMEMMQASGASAADAAVLRSDADPAAVGSLMHANHLRLGGRHLADCRMTRTDVSPVVLAHLFHLGLPLVLAVLRVLESLVAEVLVLEETVRGGAEEDSVLPSKWTVLVSDRTANDAVEPTVV